MMGHYEEQGNREIEFISTLRYLPTPLPPLLLLSPTLKTT